VEFVRRQIRLLLPVEVHETGRGDLAQDLGGVFVEDARHVRLLDRRPVVVELRKVLFELAIDGGHGLGDVRGSVGGHRCRTCLGRLQALQNPDLGEARPHLRLEHR
jgi:hypothetical protein